MSSRIHPSALICNAAALARRGMMAVWARRASSRGQAAWITLIVAVNAGLGVISSSLMARFYGADRSVDALVMAQGIATMATKVALLDKLPIVLLPLLVRDQRLRKERAWQSSSAVTFVVMLASGFLAFLAILGAQPLVQFVASGFGPDAQAETVSLLRITVPAIFLTSVNAAMATVLQSVRQFVWPFALEGVFRILTIVGIASLGSSVGVELLAWLNLASAVGVCLIQLGILVQISHGRFLRPRWSREEAREAFSMWWPYIRSNWSQLVALGANRNAASHLGVGSVAALGYAERIFTLLTQLSSQGLSTVVTQELAHDAAARDYRSFSHRLRRTGRILLLVTIPLVIVTSLLSERIIRVLFGRGRFLTHDQAAETSLLLVGYAVLLLPEITSRLGGSALQALGLTRSLVWNAVGANLVQAGAYLALGMPFGSIGIVLAMILGRSMSVLLAVLSLGRHRIEIRSPGTTRSVAVTILAAVVATLVVAAAILPFWGSQSTVTTLRQLLWIGVLGSVWIAAYGVVLLGSNLRSVRAFLSTAPPPEAVGPIPSSALGRAAMAAGNSADEVNRQPAQ